MNSYNVHWIFVSNITGWCQGFRSDGSIATPGVADLAWLIKHYDLSLFSHHFHRIEMTPEEIKIQRSLGLLPTSWNLDNVTIYVKN